MTALQAFCSPIAVRNELVWSACSTRLLGSAQVEFDQATLELERATLAAAAACGGG
jgi:hypothetical protein